MDDYLTDGEFWLPPAFLSEDDEANHTTNTATGGGYRAAAHRCSVSGLGSPIPSLTGSTETESDEEDFLAGLTRRVAGSGKMDSAVVSDNSKQASVMGTSPQSTLGILDSGGSQGSSRGSPNGWSRPTSPPATWDVLYAAAGEVQRMKASEDGTGYFDGARGISDRYKKSNPVLVSVPMPNNNNFTSPVSYDQAEQLKLLQMMKQQQGHGVWGKQQQIVRNQNKARNKSTKPVGLSASVWPPPLQPQPKGSAMRALFLEPPGNRRGCPGTGVFLPRQVGTTTPAAEPRRKSGCATVLLPARVVQALNLNLEEIGGGAQPRVIGGIVAGGDVALRLRSNNNNSGIHAQEKRCLRQTQVAVAAPNPESRLPQEWTY